MMTRLEAVNEILTATGESPVSSLDAGLAEGLLAAIYLDRAVREVQATDWSWNTTGSERKPKRLLPDAQGQVVLPPTWARVVPVGRSAGRNLTVRKDPTDDLRKIYDRDADSFNLGTKPLDVIIGMVLSFEDLPLAAQQYVTARAARLYQDDVLTSPALQANLMQREMSAWAQLLDHEAQTEVGQANILHNPDLALRRFRYRYYGG